MSNNSFSSSPSLPNTNDNIKTNVPISFSSTLQPNALDDISDFFDNYKTISVQHIIITDNSKNSVFISLYSDFSLTQIVTVENPEKNLNYKYIFNILENRGIFLKRTQFSKNFPTLHILISVLTR